MTKFEFGIHFLAHFWIANINIKRLEHLLSVPQDCYLIHKSWTYVQVRIRAFSGDFRGVFWLVERLEFLSHLLSESTFVRKQDDPGFRNKKGLIILFFRYERAMFTKDSERMKGPFPAYIECWECIRYQPSLILNRYTLHL